MVDQVFGGTLKPFLDRFFIDQERAGNFGGAKTTQCLQGQCELVLARQHGITAGEDHPQLAVFDGGIEKQLVDSVVFRGAQGHPALRRPPRHLGAPQ